MSQTLIQNDFTLFAPFAIAHLHLWQTTTDDECIVVCLVDSSSIPLPDWLVQRGGNNHPVGHWLKDLAYNRYGFCLLPSCATVLLCQAYHCGIVCSSVYGNEPMLSQSVSKIQKTSL
ncbi:hypothetical protein H6F98_19560 [Microcoleus sp. FACHB-SPT15]|uniref:hypothetical protein n=1 Tax=Microcoleus sp. FACHB-SPT15 TaxID=2692830 RepID=UPI00198BB077|nr:hypothetical protein [Microcoleus sp. FACHB-SPT15]MBD1807625.1 hypothetical protein [Microcoleus sp. FACHB-SPT15]